MASTAPCAKETAVTDSNAAGPQNARRLGVLGGGRWAITLAHVAAANGCEVMLWTADGRRAATLQKRRALKKVLPELPELHAGVTVTADIAATCSFAETLVVATSITELGAVVAKAGEFLGGHHQVVHAVRGLDGATLAFPSRMVTSQTCVRQVGALLGPVVVEDLLANRPNAAVVASAFPHVRDTMVSAFASDTLRVYSSEDLVGVEVAAAGAAVGALAIGLCLELELGAATLATFITRGSAELARVVKASGGRAESAYGLAGLGDLLARRESNSREIEAGRLLARGHDATAIEAALGHLDAIDAAQTFASLAKKRGIAAHLTGAVAAMLAGKMKPTEAIRGLMTLAQMKDV